MRPRRTAAIIISGFLSIGLFSGSGVAESERGAASTGPVADALSRAQTPAGLYISWREHLIDDVSVSGLPIGGSDGRKADVIPFSMNS